jgi:GRAM domain-containing protein 4
MGVPTDAEYAMEVISKRVASGLDIRTNKSKKSHARRNMSEAEGSQQHGASESKEGGGRNVDWQKWNDRAAIGKAWAGEGKRLFKKGVVRCQTSIIAVSVLIPNPRVFPMR